MNCVMQIHRLKILPVICLAAVLFCGCHKKTAQEIAEEKALERHAKEQVVWMSWPSWPPTYEAMKCLGGLLKSGKLPDTADARGGLYFNPDPSATNYPLSRTFELKMKSSAFHNYYTLVKKSPDGSWQITKAWRTDPQGMTVTNYLVDLPN
jgi:hypothetical protein